MKSQSGFSLVELMVVVAIIGILATLSVGAIQKQIAKSKQAEVKTNLSSLYGSQKAFFAEFQTYHTGFNTVKFSLEGNLRYNIGFNADQSAAVTGLAASGYTGTVDAANFNSNAFCPLVGAGGACGEMPAATNAPALAAGVLTIAGGMATNFVAAGSTDQLYRANDDTWTINENKVLANTLDGLLN
jgi:type IV pilus assembly protein PilA